MDQTKCLEKYEDYFNDELADNEDLFNSVLSDEAGCQHLYQNFLTYKKAATLKKSNTNEQQLTADLNKFNHTIELVYKKLSASNKSILLVVGQVQSGKTDFVIGLTSKIIAQQTNKINIIINLTTNIVSLNEQTQERFHQFYRAIEFNAIVNRYNFSNLTELVNKQQKLENNTLFFLLKNKNHLEKINKYLTFLNQTNTEFNVVIIDDEGDNASFNTNQKAQDETELSTINRKLNQMLKANFHFNISLVSITATPLVHYFASKKNNLKPHDACLLETGSGYTGVLEYNEEFNKPDSKVINQINIDDENSTEKNFSLIRAIICYLVLCSLNQEKIYGNKKIKPRMMINMDYKKDQHNNLKVQIIEKLNEYKKSPELIKTHLENYQVWNLVPDFVPLNEKNKQNLIKKMQNLINKNFYEIIAINSDNPDEQISFDNDETEKFQILIGSYKLSRGLTIKNLICVYMSIRTQENSYIDVLLQRARWFGYHQAHLKCMRIFLTRDLIRDYAIAADLMNNLYNTIKLAQEKEIKFWEIERFIAVEEYRHDLKAVNKRAPTQWEMTTLKNTFIKNKYKNETDKMDFLLAKFKKQWNGEKENKSAYPVLKFANLKTLISKWFQTNQEFCKAVGMTKKDFNYFIIKNNLLKLSAYIRLISQDPNNLTYKQRIITWESYDNEYTFGNGTYADGFLQNSNEIKIDLLPLEIWSKNDKKIRLKIFRLRLFLPLEKQAMLTSEFGIRGL